MILRLINTAILTALLFLVGVVAFAVLEADPDTAQLDQDLASIRASIARAEGESDKYEAGVLKSLIEMDREVLFITRDMLEAKKLSVLRRVSLNYTIPAPASTNDTSTMQAIERELSETNDKIVKADSEAARYTGGLVQTMALLTAATERFSYSMLRMKLLTARYSLGLPIPNIPATKTPASPPGKVVKDKDAL